jgi:hypothetical protein
MLTMINEDKLRIILQDLNNLVTNLVIREAKRDFKSADVMREIREHEEVRKRTIEEVFDKKEE